MKLTRRGLFGLIAGTALGAVVGKERLPLTDPTPSPITWAEVVPIRSGQRIYAGMDISQFRAVNKRVHWGTTSFDATVLPYMVVHQTNYVARGT